MKIKPSLRWRLAQWLEIRWWQHYLRQREPIVYRQQKTTYWQRTLEKLHLHLPSQQKVLDAGCGPAGIFMVLSDHQVDAVDPLLTKYQIQLSHFQPSDYPWVNFYPSSIESFQPKQAYDFTFCLNAINHVANWERGLDQLSKYTRPGGTLVMGIDVHRYKFLKHLFRLLPGDALHPHQHDREDYRKALQARGWGIRQQLTWKEGFIFDYWLIVCKRV